MAMNEDIRRKRVELREAIERELRAHHHAAKLDHGPHRDEECYVARVHGAAVSVEIREYREIIGPFRRRASGRIRVSVEGVRNQRYQTIHARRTFVEQKNPLDATKIAACIARHAVAQARINSDRAERAESASRSAEIQEQLRELYPDFIRMLSIDSNGCLVFTARDISKEEAVWLMRALNMCQEEQKNGPVSQDRKSDEG